MVLRLSNVGNKLCLVHVRLWFITKKKISPHLQTAIASIVPCFVNFQACIAVSWVVHPSEILAIIHYYENVTLWFIYLVHWWLRWMMSLKWVLATQISSILHSALLKTCFWFGIAFALRLQSIYILVSFPSKKAIVRLPRCYNSLLKTSLLMSQVSMSTHYQGLGREGVTSRRLNCDAVQIGQFGLEFVVCRAMKQPSFRFLRLQISQMLCMFVWIEGEEGRNR